MPLLPLLIRKSNQIAGKIFDIGSVNESGSLFHSNSTDSKIYKGRSIFVCYNIFNHDLKYLEKVINDTGINKSNFY